MLVGLAVSMPLGPVGVLIVQRTVSRNRVSGFLTGLGASLSDVLYAVVAGFSLTYILDFIRQHQFGFQVLGTIVLFLLGIYIFRKNPVEELRKYRQRGCTYLRDLLSTFLITFSNPLAIFIFLAVFASSGIAFHADQPYRALILLLGILAGASSWWFVLTHLVSSFRHHFSLRLLWWFNKISGVLIMLLVLVSIVFSLI